MTDIASLDLPFHHAAVIEGTLLDAYPGVWHGVYYFDPRRDRRPEEEGNIVFNLIREAHGDIHLRTLQNFYHSVTSAVMQGRGSTIPVSAPARRVACYLMTERDQDLPRLKAFFGDAAGSFGSTAKLGRLFEEYVARHEIYHSVEMLEPEFHGRTGCSRRESESGADAYALLSMARLHGDVIKDFTKTLHAARDFQRAAALPGADDYATSPSIAGVADYLGEHGCTSLRRHSERDVFHTARQIARRSLCCE